MRNLIRRIKCFFYRDELRTLSALAFACRLYDGLATYSEWMCWSGPSAVDYYDFVCSSYWLEEERFVSRVNNRYQPTKEGEEWYESLTYKRLG